MTMESLKEAKGNGGNTHQRNWQHQEHVKLTPWTNDPINAAKASDNSNLTKFLGPAALQSLSPWIFDRALFIMQFSEIILQKTNSTTEKQMKHSNTQENKLMI